MMIVRIIVIALCSSLCVSSFTMDPRDYFQSFSPYTKYLIFPVSIYRIFSIREHARKAQQAKTSEIIVEGANGQKQVIKRPKYSQEQCDFFNENTHAAIAGCLGAAGAIFPESSVSGMLTIMAPTDHYFYVGQTALPSTAYSITKGMIDSVPLNLAKSVRIGSAVVSSFGLAHAVVKTTGATSDRLLAHLFIYETMQHCNNEYKNKADGIVKDIIASSARATVMVPTAQWITGTIYKNPSYYTLRKRVDAADNDNDMSHCIVPTVTYAAVDFAGKQIAKTQYGQKINKHADDIINHTVQILPKCTQEPAQKMIKAGGVEAVKWGVSVMLIEGSNAAKNGCSVM
jgi:hypothetical protein